MKNKQNLADFITKNAQEPYKTALLQEIRPSVRLRTTGAEEPGIGHTKLGGCPDLPVGTQWPKSPLNDQYFTFLAQINLAEVAAFDELTLLPSNGMLYFFHDVNSVDAGTVIFTTATALERADAPESLVTVKKSWLKRLLTGRPLKKILKESGVTISTEYNIPSADSLIMERIQKETATDIPLFEAFHEVHDEDLEEQPEPENTSDHHLIGHYNGIQGSFHELECIDFSLEQPKNLRLSTIKDALEWKILLQFDSDKNLDFNFADRGRIYFFIHQDDLKQRNFEQVKVHADCY